MYDTVEGTHQWSSKQVNSLVCVYSKLEAIRWTGYEKQAKYSRSQQLQNIAFWASHTDRST